MEDLIRDFTKRFDIPRVEEDKIRDMDLGDAEALLVLMGSGMPNVPLGKLRGSIDRFRDYSGEKDAIDCFRRRQNIDDKSQDLLESLTRAAGCAVISNIDPNSVRNINAMVMALCNKATGLGLGRDGGGGGGGGGSRRSRSRSRSREKIRDRSGSRSRDRRRRRSGSRDSRD